MINAIPQVDEEEVTQMYDVTVAKIEGKKHALHIAVEKNDLYLVKQLLDKVAKLDNRKTLLLQVRRGTLPSTPNTPVIFYIHQTICIV